MQALTELVEAHRADLDLQKLLTRYVASGARIIVAVPGDHDVPRLQENELQAPLRKLLTEQLDVVVARIAAREATIKALEDSLTRPVPAPAPVPASTDEPTLYNSRNWFRWDDINCKLDKEFPADSEFMLALCTEENWNNRHESSFVVVQHLVDTAGFAELIEFLEEIKRRSQSGTMIIVSNCGKQS
jgi:hypothetical protein